MYFIHTIVGIARTHCASHLARFCVLIAVLGCTAASPTSNEKPTAAAPGTLDRWKLALDAVCTHKAFDPAKELPAGSIAVSKVFYRCTLGDTWRDGPDKGETGGSIYLDAQQVPNRIEFEAVGARADLVGLMRNLTSRYGVAAEVIARVEHRLTSCKMGRCFDDDGEVIDNNSRLHVNLTPFGNNVSIAMLISIVRT
jgi:hypothetical protein